MDTFFSPAPPAPDGGAGDEPPNPDIEGAAPLGEAPDADPQPPQAAAPALAPAAPAAPANPELPEGAALDANGKQIRIDVPRWNNIYGNYKFAQEVRQFAPTVEEARGQYQRASDLRHMHADFTSGDPASMDEFVKHWETQSPDGFALMASRVIERAPAPVREQFAEQAIGSRADALYARAAETQDPQDLYKARMFEWSATGKYRTDPLQVRDPLADRERSIAEREQRFQQSEQQRSTEAWNNWSASTNQQIGTQLAGTIDQMLAPIKERFADAPDLFKALRDQVRAQVISKVEGDKEWVRNFNLDYRGARKTMSPGDRQALVGTYLAKAGQVVAATATPLINQATKVLVAQNQQSHDRLARGAAQRGTAAPGHPTARSIMPQGDRGKMSLEDKIDADMDLRAA